MRQLPQSIVDINAFVAGVGHLGTTASFELPKIKEGKGSKAGGGFEVDYWNGTFEKMEAKLELDTYSSAIFEAFSKMEDKKITVKGSISQDGNSIPAVVTIKGSFDIDPGAWKPKEEVKLSIDIPTVTYYKLEINGKEMVLMDAKNMVARINGVDKLEKLRAHIQ